METSVLARVENRLVDVEKMLHLTNTGLTKLTTEFSGFAGDAQEFRRFALKLQELDHRLDIVEEKQASGEKKRWDVSKMILSALIPILIGGVIWLFSRQMEQERLGNAKIDAIMKVEDSIIQKLEEMRKGPP